MTPYEVEKTCLLGSVYTNNKNMNNMLTIIITIGIILIKIILFLLIIWII